MLDAHIAAPATMSPAQPREAESLFGESALDRCIVSVGQWPVKALYANNEEEQTAHMLALQDTDAVVPFDGLIVDRISAALRRDILQGELKEGQPLRQDAIARRFETSRVPVREALRKLEAEGLVIFHPRRGASVVSVDADQILEMFDIRIALECYLLRLAVPNMSLRDFEEARNILAEYESVGDQIDPDGWDDLNWRFHARLYVAAHRPAMFALVRDNYYKQARSVRVRIAIATGRATPHGEHIEIWEACKAGDGDAAAALLQSHLENTKKAVATEMHMADMNGPIGY